VQLDELVESSVERARSRFPGVKFSAELAPTTVSGVPERLERAVWNLLENAGKWSPEGSTVEVSLAGSELRVRDHGPGIAPDDRAHVFDRFYRSAAAARCRGRGSGSRSSARCESARWQRVGRGRRQAAALMRLGRSPS
jgi:two-component system sensor histidine kinase MprB